MKALLLIVGIAALLAGLLFAGQGTGYIPWPRTSFMISDMHWAYYGAGIAGFGIVLMWISSRLGR
ncbi:MAG: hypothetical protein KGM97_08140 [Alphaproteobacteria bacterium]|nr:hypothetical protein [Alphaproteobacteria bacterium]MDE2630944.1 hypothetical protein [Alphaproteobacteria bacterium]